MKFANGMIHYTFIGNVDGHWKVYHDGTNMIVEVPQGEWKKNGSVYGYGDNNCLNTKDGFTT